MSATKRVADWMRRRETTRPVQSAPIEEAELSPATEEAELEPAPQPESTPYRALSPLERADAEADRLQNAYFAAEDRANSEPITNDEDSTHHRSGEEADPQEVAFYEGLDRNARFKHLELMHHLNLHPELADLGDKWRSYYEQLRNPDLQPDLNFAAERASEITRGRAAAGIDWNERQLQQNDRDYLDYLHEGGASQGVPFKEVLVSDFYRQEHGLEATPRPVIDQSLYGVDEPPF